MIHNPCCWRRLGGFCQQMRLAGFATAKVVVEAQDASFHKRPLPANLIALSSSAGKNLFKQSLADGTLESYFPLSEQFVTQSEPSYCSLSSLVMVLNALNYDPKKIWKGPWRWISEEMLHCESKELCGHSKEKVRTEGMNFHEFETLARCHGVSIVGYRACHSADKQCGDEGFNQFRTMIDVISRSDKNDMFLVTNFSRKHLNQTGDGHFSPIAGYNQRTGHVLVMDVARFKYPPYWVHMEDLWESMAVIDKASGKPRGYFLISSRDPKAAHANCKDDTHHQLPLTATVCVEGQEPLDRKCCAPSHAGHKHSHADHQHSHSDHKH